MCYTSICGVVLGIVVEARPRYVSLDRTMGSVIYYDILCTMIGYVLSYTITVHHTFHYFCDNFVMVSIFLDMFGLFAPSGVFIRCELWHYIDYHW
jgi:hypothetical protein